MVFNLQKECVCLPFYPDPTPIAVLDIILPRRRLIRVFKSVEVKYPSTAAVISR